MHPVHRVAFLVTTEVEEAKNFMATKLFMLLSDDKKQQHPEKYNLLEEEDKWIIGRTQRNKKNVKIIIICSVGLVLEHGLVIGFHTNTLEHRWLKYNDCILCGYRRSVFIISGEMDDFRLKIKNKTDATS